MAALNENHWPNNDTQDRLTQQRDYLARQLAILEKQLVETAQHLAAVDEHILRLRHRQRTQLYK